MGPEDMGARKMTRTAYKLAKTADKLTVLMSTLLHLQLRDLLGGTGGGDFHSPVVDYNNG
jgi:hypothetical protein